MKKLSTLFKKDPNDLGRVINEIDPQNQWVLDGEGLATIKFDGTAVAIFGGKMWKRYDVKHGKPVPFGAVPCQEPDEITGHWPHWVEVYTDSPADKYIVEAFTMGFKNHLDNSNDGTYEAYGEKINGNKEKVEGHWLVKHGRVSARLTHSEVNFEGIKAFLSNPDNDIEGIVFHHKTDGRMCKIRKSDFGIKR